MRYLIMVINYLFCEYENFHCYIVSLRLLFRLRLIVKLFRNAPQNDGKWLVVNYKLSFLMINFFIVPPSADC